MASHASSPQKVNVIWSLGWQVALGIPNEWHPCRAFLPAWAVRKYKTHTHITSSVCRCVCVCLCEKSQMPAMHLVLWSWLISFQEDRLEPPPDLTQHSLDEAFCQLAPGSCFEAMQATCPHPGLALPSPTNHAPHPNPAPCPPSVLFSSAPTPR